MKVAVALVALLALSLLAHVCAFSERNYQAHPYPGAISEQELCRLVGQVSGCSGCEIGTKKQCTWMAREVSVQKKRGIHFNDLPVSFYCVPSRSVTPLLELTSSSWAVASSLCPADPVKEPIVRTYFAETVESFQNASTVHTKWFDADLADFPHHPWPVDRTSFYGGVGVGRLIDAAVSGKFLDCARVSERGLVDLHLEVAGAAGKESNLLNGYLFHERDKACSRIVLSSYLSSRCPEYGVAVSGLCQSFYDQILNNCRRHANVGALKDGSAPYSKAVEAWFVVPDSTPYCLTNFTVQPSGAMEELAGLHIPVSTLQEMWDDGRSPFTYDCDCTSVLPNCCPSPIR